MREGSIWVEGESLAYIDEDREKRTIPIDELLSRITSLEEDVFEINQEPTSSPYEVVESGDVQLTEGRAIVDTDITNNSATFLPALGVADPDDDVKLVSRLFWDDSQGDDGRYMIEIIEDGTSVGNPVANYDILRVR